MSFNIEFDYRFDTSGFFDDPETRAVLEAAGDIWEDLIQDEFADIPAGAVFQIDDPSNSGTQRTVTLDRPIDDLMIFVGAADLTPVLGLGGYDGVNISGDVYRSRIASDFRGETASDFEPWAGTITFNTTSNWNFDIDNAVAGKSDFISVALHEIAHILGIGTSPIFREIGEGQMFSGFNAMQLNNGEPVPLQAGLGHVSEGFDGNTVLLDPILTQGTRQLPGRFDLALLSDIGYEIEGYVKQGDTPPIATQGDDGTIFGTDLDDTIDGLGGNDQLQGADGNDSLTAGAGDDVIFGGQGDDILVSGAGNDTLYGGDGVDGFVVRSLGGNVVISDFDLDEETITLEGSGFESAAAAVAGITKPFSNVSEIAFLDGTTVRLFHQSMLDSPIMEESVVVVTNDTIVTGDASDNTLTGTQTSDRIFGLDGDDTLIGNAGEDTIDGGAGLDTWAAIGPDAVSVDLALQVATDGFGDADSLVSIENATGGVGNDVLTGSSDANVLDGGVGRDTMIGGQGDDVFFVDNRADRLVENAGEGNDVVFAAAEVTLRDAEIEKVVLEGTGNLRVNGNQYATEVIGNEGSNILVAGGGGDILTGGAGTDYFAFVSSAAAGGAPITDFSRADKIAIDDQYIGFGDAAIDIRDVSQVQFSNAIRSKTAIYDGSTGMLYIDPDGRNGPLDAVLVATIEGGGRLFADDFLLF